MDELVTIVIMAGRQPASCRQTAVVVVQQLSRSERRRRHAAGWLSVECDARARSAFRVAEDQESSERQEHLSHFQIQSTEKSCRFILSFYVFRIYVFLSTTLMI